jgi:hypothetical protein
MLENILTVAGAVAQSAEQTNKLMVQTVNTGFENGSPASRIWVSTSLRAFSTISSIRAG